MVEKHLNALAEVERYLKLQENKEMLRFITCGSVDDGKSTLIGRLLWDSKLIYEDQLASLKFDSKKVGTQGGAIDYALLLDGLQAEREQGITIDIAYRFFSTDKRKFIVADTPGHEQYTRNMVTGASTAEVAVILVDARKGLLTQTKRHSYLVSLVGIRNVVLAVNKMDLVGYDQNVFYSIVSKYQDFANQLGFENIVAIPVSALEGDNVISESNKMPWYDGTTLLSYLETVEAREGLSKGSFRFPVQWINRPSSEFRGFSGTVKSGGISVGDEIVVASSGQIARVDRIVTMDGSQVSAGTGEAITLTLNKEIDISRGELVASPKDRPTHSDQFRANLVWLHEDHLIPGRSYLAKLGGNIVPAQVTQLKEKVEVNTLQHLAGKTLEMNEVGIVNVALSRPLSFDSFGDNPATGSFILIDRQTNATVGAGMIQYALRRASNIHIQGLAISKKDRSVLLGQNPSCLWFTGLSGSGKSTIANAVAKTLHAQGRLTYVLDGDNVRHGINKDLGFKDEDRVENIRRVTEIAKLMVDAGIIVLCAFISPFAAERRLAKEIFGAGEFFEIFVDTPLEICEARDRKGLYSKARKGQLTNFTGIDSAYEKPEIPDLTVKGFDSTESEIVDQIIQLINP